MKPRQEGNGYVQYPKLISQEVMHFDNLITKEKLAAHLGVSKSMINKLMTKGLPIVKIGRSVRFDLNKVMPWIERRSI